MKDLKILYFEIETSPIISYTWGLWDQNVGLNQIKSDWHVLSWAAKWQGTDKVLYQDQRACKELSNDRKLLLNLWELLDEADIVVTQNGRKFDSKKLNARFIIHGFKPPAPYRHIDTLVIAKKHFGFTSNKLEYMASKLCTKYKKLTEHEFQGFELWKQCLAGNMKAWKVMEKYNKHDVLALEELYTKLAPWDNSVNMHVYKDGECKCGSENVEKRGFSFTVAGKYQRYQCRDCGTWTRGAENLATHKARRAIA